MAKRKTKKKALRSKVRSFSAADFRHKAYSLADMVKGLNQFMSLAAISRETGIPRTTLRRYRDGGRPGGEFAELYQGILQSGFGVIHKEVVREKSARKVRAVGKGKRVLRVDPRDRTKRIASDSLDYNIMNSDTSAILAKMLRGAERARLLGVPGIVRTLLLGHEGSPDYPGEYFWSEPEALSDLGADEIEGVLGDWFARGTPIILRMQDREM